MAKNIVAALFVTLFSPNHPVHDASVALDDLYDLAACVFRRHPDTDFGNIRTAYWNYPDSVSETSGHLAWLTT